MPSPGTPAPPRLPIEDSSLELLADTLESLDLPARGQFLQRYFRAVTHLDLRESQCLQFWDETLARRKELSELVRRPVALKTVLVDVLASAGWFRVPILIEYDDLKKLQLNAVTDPLTGLYNRRLFGETFEKELNRARRYGLPLGLVVLDLHRFKEVNDKHGHPRGDEVLRADATTLKSALRTSDSASPAPAERPGVPPRTISIETKRPTEKADDALTVAASTAAAGISAPSPSPGPVVPHVYTVPRKAERVSMTGTNAYAVLGEQGTRRARVLDLGFGGVALELDSAADLPQSMLAVLHVHILPPVRANLKPV